MINNDYSHYKKEALSLYKEYEKALGEKIDSSIKNEAKAIEENIFNLMVLGEAKSGKSTFINAYLGKEILPMDVRQCTSAIIKIKHGEEIKLIATTADGNKKEENDLEGVSNFLKKEAAIDDNYRQIPITTINNELIRKEGRIDDKDIEEFLEEVKDDNIYNLAPEEYNDLIRDYIEEKKDKWGEIITEINITCHLSEKMKDITLVDSPGVGAGGNVGEITENYINKANAIIFVKYLKGQALESTSFMKLLRNKISEKSKDFLFLVFTGISELSDNDLKKLEKQAIDMYKKDISEDKILFVDSKIQLFSNKSVELKTEEEIDKFFNDLESKGENFGEAENCWLKAKGNFDRFKENMEKKSNFDKVFKAIDTFARKANYQRLEKFLEAIKKNYDSEEAKLSEQIKFLKKDFKSPEEFEKEIDKITEEINVIFVKVNDGVDKISSKYKADENGIIAKEGKGIEEDFKKKLEEFKEMKEYEIKDKETFDLLKKETMDALNKVEELQKYIARGVIEDCDKELLDCSKEKNLSFANMASPVFAESDFDKIKDDTKKNPEVSGSEEIDRGITFSNIERRAFYHRNKHLKIVVNNIEERFNDIVSTIKKSMLYCVEGCINEYKYKLKEQTDRLQADYEKLKEAKDDNDEKLKKINEFEKKLSELETNIENINKLKEEIKKLC